MEDISSFSPLILQNSLASRLMSQNNFSQKEQIGEQKKDKKEMWKADHNNTAVSIHANRTASTLIYCRMREFSGNNFRSLKNTF